MAYVSIPKDLNSVKTKFMFNLTKRQCICFTLAIMVGLPMFFTLKNYVDTSSATISMIAVMSPFFMLAMYEKHNQPLEVVLKQVILVKYILPKNRPYQNQNFYRSLENQYDINKEMITLGRKTTNTKATESQKAKVDKRRKEKVKQSNNKA